MPRLINSLLLLYIVMLMPGRLTIYDLFVGDWYYPQMMYESGAWSIRFLILTVSVTPILILINRIGYGAGLGRWLLRRRKHFGLVSFIFAAIHMLHYIRYTGDLQAILSEAATLALATGWLALMVLIALALTSYRKAIRVLGPMWKALHMGIYPAIALSFFHWYLLDFFTARVLFWIMVFTMVKLSHGALLQVRKPTRA